MKLTTYRNCFALAYLAAVAVIWGVAMWLWPVDGDLTRVGGFPENAFQWQEPQRAFEKNRFHVTASLQDYDRHYDVVILGDSFSCDQLARRSGWQNWFCGQTGLSVIVLDTRRYYPQEVIASPAFQKFPPRYFIFQSVERYLFDRVAYFSTLTPRPLRRPPVPRQLPVLAEVAPPGELLDLPASGSGQADAAIAFLNTRVRRAIGLNHQARLVPLTNDALFSCRVSSQMLVYFDEFLKQQLNADQLDQLREGAVVFRDLVESNGVTNFVLFAAPDKSSVYQPYLAREEDATMNLVAELTRDDPRLAVRTDLALAALIATGTRDVYLPNDSHWGWQGHRVAGQALVDYLLSQAESVQQSSP